MPKEAKYFCEFCDTEVEEDAKECPKCGRVFSSVVCASCGYSGAGIEFAAGCPKCGYAERKRSVQRAAEKTVRKKTGIESLPWWVFLAADVVLGGIILFLIFRRVS